MTVNADGPSGNGPSAGAGDTASGTGAVNPSDLEKAVNDAVSKAIGSRMKRLNIEEQIAKAVEAALSKVESVKPEIGKQTDAGDPAGAEKLSLKALHEQIASLNKGIEAERRARAEAERRAHDVRRTSSVESAFAKHLGADSPHLKPYVAHYLGQFEDREGIFGRKVTGQYGDEQFMPLDEAVGELFKSELKYLVNQSKAPILPATGYGLARGQAITPQALQSQKGINPFMGEVLSSIAESRPEVAQQLATAAVNGTSRK